MPTHSHTQAVFDHYHRALTFCPQPAKIQEPIAGLHWTLGDIPQAMEHYLQAHALNPQAQWHHWRLYFGLQRLAGLESPKILEFCQRIVDLVKPNTHQDANWGFTLLLLSTAYRYWGEGDVATQEQAHRAGTILHQSDRAILEPDYPELIHHAWTERRNHPPNLLIIGVWKCGTTSLDHYLSQHPQILPTLA